jgi:hypothetical protein
MTSEEFYRDLDACWCQGDIIREVPHIHIKPPLIAVRKETTKSGERFAPFEYHLGLSGEEGPVNNPPRGSFKIATGDEVLASCQLAFGMILTHGCEIDKDLRYCQVALIRPLSAVPLESQDVIRTNKNLSYCYLPPYKEIMGESYVDFRRITTLHPAFLNDSERVVSLTDDAVKYVHTLLFRFWTRRDIDPDALDQLPVLP